MKFVAATILLLLNCFIGSHGDNFLVLGDWGGSSLPPYFTNIEKSTAKQMADTASQKKTSFVLALGKPDVSVDNFYLVKRILSTVHAKAPKIEIKFISLILLSQSTL